MERFIQINDIPASLWSDSKQTLFLPELLVESWKVLLNENVLEDKAIQQAPSGFTGGMSKSDTDKHLAWRYTGSCGRVVMTAIDPKGHLNEVSDAYAKTFSGNRVLLADLPCGSGAGSISIITTLIELRKYGVLPRIPLSIKVVAADISQYALDYCSRQLDSIKSLATEQAIDIEYETFRWDVLDKVSTSDLIGRLTILNQYCDHRLLLLTNFTDFLEKNNKWKEAEPQFEQIFISSRGESSTAIWIEPGHNITINFFNRLVTFFNKFLNTLKKSIPNISSDYAKTGSKCKHPLKEHLFNVSLNVKRFQLPTKD